MRKAGWDWENRAGGVPAAVCERGCGCAASGAMAVEVSVGYMSFGWAWACGRARGRGTLRERDGMGGDRGQRGVGWE
jgi:hypothetical protein